MVARLDADRVQLARTFDVELEHVLGAAGRLRALGVAPLSFFGEETDEPTVIGWLPAATVYFRDPDRHQLEYLAMLDTEPRAKLVITPLVRVDPAGVDSPAPA